MDSLEKVGRISKSFGLPGELIVNLYDCFPADFNIEEPLFAMIDSLTVPLFFEKFQPRGRSSALVKFADFDSDSRAAELTGKELFLINNVQSEEIEDSDELLFEDLIGYTALFEGSIIRGTISDYIDSEHNPLFEIKAVGKEIYVPANEEMIYALNIEKREIEFTLPNGLLDLYL